jgi:hypothetical protein
MPQVIDVVSVTERERHASRSRGEREPIPKPGRSGGGSNPTLDGGPISTALLRSSIDQRNCAPQVGFSVASRKMSRRVSIAVDGRPGALVGWVQWRAMRRRCHRSNVSGVTNQPARSRRGSAAPIAPSSVRSSSLSAGRSIWRRRTLSWWRRTMISRSLDRPERTARRANKAMKRHRIRDTAIDDGGRSALVKPHNQIFGPHSPDRLVAKHSIHQRNSPVHRTLSSRE